jgi:two-component system OmpR family sensor kinase
MREHLRRTRVRLTLVAVGAIFPVAVLAAAGFWAVFAALEVRAVDSSLDAQAQVLTSALESGSDRVDPAAATPLPSVTQAGIAVNAVLFAPGGAAVDRSGQVGDPAAYTPDRQPSAPLHETRRIDGVVQRLLIQPVGFANGTGVLVLARPLDELLETLAEVGALLACAVVAVVLVAAGLGYWLAGRALSPVGVMVAAARDITEHDLHRRIDLDLPPGDELGELAATFNAMLDRVETAFAGLQRFTADAAHELRAPLAQMRAQVDVVLRRERTPEEYRASHRAILDEIERLSRMADQLLLLARADAGALHARADTLDLPELLEEIVERWRPAAMAREVRLESELPLEGELRADPELLRRLFDNLLDNALRHAPARGEVRLSASADERTWRIAVEDTGPGVAPELRPRLFERFARGDRARGRDTGGAGLGLSLSAAIAAVHGGSIAVEEAQAGQGARFVVVLPVDREATRRRLA